MSKYDFIPLCFNLMKRSINAHLRWAHTCRVQAHPAILNKQIIDRDDGTNGCRPTPAVLLFSEDHTLSFPQNERPIAY